MKEAVICLLFKKGDKSQLKNWRTISLLNVDYKILTKILNHRIKSALPKLLSLDQKGFVPTRRLDDAVLKVQLLMDYCKRQGLSKYLLFLDQEKALHLIVSIDNLCTWSLKHLTSHPLLEILSKQFTTQLWLRYRSTVNYHVALHSFRVSAKDAHSHQHCFALCIETLGNLIRSDPNVKGIKVHGINTFKLTIFADDTTIFIWDRHCLDAVLEIIKIYEQGSGAKANVSKTELFPIGTNKS